MSLLWTTMEVISSPGAGTPPRVAPQGWENSSQYWVFGWVPFELSLNSSWTVCHESLPWSRDTPQHLRFLDREVLPWTRWRDLHSWQILSELLISSWINNVILPTYVLGINKLCVDNSIRHKPLPKLRLRLDLNAPWLCQEFRQHSEICDSMEGSPLPFCVSHLSVNPSSLIPTQFSFVHFFHILNNSKLCFYNITLTPLLLIHFTVVLSVI